LLAKPRRNMTLIAGFRCRDGLILCADTQETISGYTKLNTDKIRGLMYTGGCINVAGAGDADLIEMAVDRLVDHFLLDDCQVTDWRRTQREIEGVLVPLFEDQARRNSFLPSEERPWSDLLIAYRAEDGKELLKISGTKVRRVRAAQCLGTGMILANSLVSELFDQNMTMKQAGLLAIYAVFRAKRYVDGVGGNTDILFIGDYGLTRIPTSDVQRIESWWLELEQSGISLARALTATEGIDKNAVATLADFKDTLAFYDEIYKEVDAVLNPTTKPEAGMMVTKILHIDGRRFFQSEGGAKRPASRNKKVDQQ